MAAKTHGCSGTPIYYAWKRMHSRCYDPTNADYKNYGGRGITVCPEWHDDPAAFCTWALANGWKKGLLLDRKENNGNYEPNNCRWVTSTESSNNTRSNRMIHAFGLTKSMKDWSRDPRCVVLYGTLQGRLVHGWDEERAITEPKNPYGVYPRKTKSN